MPKISIIIPVYNAKDYLERLTGYYLYKLTKNKNLKYKTAEVLSTESNITDAKKIINILKQRVKSK